MKASINRSGCIGCTLWCRYLPGCIFYGRRWEGGCQPNAYTCGIAGKRPKCPLSMSRIGYRH